MADEWLLSYAERTAAWEERAVRLKATDPEFAAGFLEAAARLARREPDFLVVANASGPLGSRFAWTTFMPLVGEFLALLRVKSILYDNGNTTRRRLIVDDFIDGDRSGIIVHISTDPWSVVRDGLNSADPTVHERAVGTAHWLAAVPGIDRPDTKAPAGVETTLYPMRRGTIARLVQRAYVLACVQGHIWHDLPLVEGPPLGWFEGLEAGRVEDRPSPPEQLESAAVLELELAEPGDTVPVWVDAIRDVGGTPMARVTYFVVASEVPEPSWLLELGERHGASVMALGMMGVICGPGARTTLFREPSQLGGLFEQIESVPNLSIDVEDLSMPATWFGPREPARGDVFRIDRALFQAAYRFRTAQLSTSEFLGLAAREAAVRFSPEETIAFHDWAQARIDEAIRVYPKDEDLRLPSLEAS
jgi:hypothetical protein